MSRNNPKLKLGQRAKRAIFRRVDNVILEHLPMPVMVGVAAARVLLEIAEKQGWFDCDDEQKRTWANQLKTGLKRADEIGDVYMPVDANMINLLVGHTMKAKVLVWALHRVPGGKKVETLATKAVEKGIARAITSATKHQRDRDGGEPPHLAA